MPLRVRLRLLMLGTAVAALAGGVLAAPVGPVSVTLNPGWNAVAFQAAQLTAVSANPAVAGVAFWDGTQYQIRNLTVADLNASGGGRRGYWVFASSATSFTYSATDDSQGNLVSLSNGYNLVSFANNADFAASTLTASVNGTSVPLGQVVLPTFYEIGADNTYLPVDATTGTIRAGRAYWIFASGSVSLRYPGGSPPPSPGPSGSPLPFPSVNPSALPAVSPRTLQVTQLAPYRVGSTNFTANTTLDMSLTIAPSLNLTATGNFIALASGSAPFTVTCAAAGNLGPGTNNFTTVTGTLNPILRTGTMTVLGRYPATVAQGSGPAVATNVAVNATFNVRLENNNTVTIVLPPTTAPANSTTGVNPTNFQP